MRMPPAVVFSRKRHLGKDLRFHPSSSHPKQEYRVVLLLVITFLHYIKQIGHQPGMIVNPPCGQQRGESGFSPSPFAPENLVLQDRLGRPFPPSPGHFPHPGLIGCFLAGSSLLPPAFRDLGVHLHRQPPSDQSRGNQVTQLRTGRVHPRESADTGPAAL